MIAKATKFLQEVRTEMSKVSWPTRQELKGQTWIVILVSLFFRSIHLCRRSLVVVAVESDLLNRNR